MTETYLLVFMFGMVAGVLVVVAMNLVFNMLTRPGVPNCPHTPLSPPLHPRGEMPARQSGAWANDDPPKYTDVRVLDRQTCTCGTPGLTYEGPQPDCPVHG